MEAYNMLLQNHWVTEEIKESIKIYLQTNENGNTMIQNLWNTGWSKDGVLEGCGILISSQLGHLPGTGGGPRTPKGMGGTPSDRVGHGV